MNEILQFVGTFASVFSIPLAIILYIKTSDTRQNKIRLDIIRSISYRIGEGKALARIEVSAVFNSKIREHNIRKPFFSETTILEDIIADAVSNPFLTSEQKTTIIEDVATVLEAYGVVEKKASVDKADLHVKYTKYDPIISEVQGKRRTSTAIFGLVTAMLSTIIAIVSLYGTIFPDLLRDINFPFEVLLSLLVTIFAGVITMSISILFRKANKKQSRKSLSIGVVSSEKSV